MRKIIMVNVVVTISTLMSKVMHNELTDQFSLNLKLERFSTLPVFI